MADNFFCEVVGRVDSERSDNPPIGRSANPRTKFPSRHGMAYFPPNELWRNWRIARQEPARTLLTHACCWLSILLNRMLNALRHSGLWFMTKAQAL